jgi:hypothetical protein
MHRSPARAQWIRPVRARVCRYLVPAAVLQCAWAAVAAAVDLHKLRATPPNRWALWAFVVLDGVSM